jgi:uncharacterized membrane protein YdjX (TVP38/TMEM64 family)
MLFRSSNQVSQCVRKLNPVLLLMIFSVLIFLVRKVFFPQYTDDMLISALQGLLAQLGLLSVVYLLLGFVVCAFFFIPVLMPLCILCGAFYGPVQGSVVALAGITLGCVATTVSVRRVFRGMGRVVMDNPEYKNLLVKLTHHGVVVVLLVRLAFVVPYILQNILLALTNISIARLTLLTLLGGIPGAVSDSFLGAGLVSLGNTGLYGAMVMVPVVVLYLVNAQVSYLRRKHGLAEDTDLPSYTSR